MIFHDKTLRKHKRLDGAAISHQQATISTVE